MRINHWIFLKYSAVLILILAVFMVALTQYEAATKTSKNEASISLARGQTIFADICSHCHSARSMPFKTTPKEVPQRLRDPRILPHQFQLSNRQIKDLVNYLNELAKPR
jgi:cytochrome c1